MAIQKISAIIIQGYGVASGTGEDTRFPEGSIKMQMPHFRKRGLDLSTYYPGTLNLDISPYDFELGKPKYYFEGITWSKYMPPENFYFFDITLSFNSNIYHGLVYLPDPKTKVDHPQPDHMLEVLAPLIPGASYGKEINIELDDSCILLKDYKPKH
jgi:CTP-dependent riboflavin kinase